MSSSDASGDGPVTDADGSIAQDADTAISRPIPGGTDYLIQRTRMAAGPADAPEPVGFNLDGLTSESACNARSRNVHREIDNQFSYLPGATDWGPYRFWFAIRVTGGSDPIVSVYATIPSVDPDRYASESGVEGGLEYPIAAGRLARELDEEAQEVALDGPVRLVMSYLSLDDLGWPYGAFHVVRPRLRLRRTGTGVSGEFGGVLDAQAADVRDLAYQLLPGCDYFQDSLADVPLADETGDTVCRGVSFGIEFEAAAGRLLGVEREDLQLSDDCD